MWAALFPGQGSQSVGMGKLFFDNFTLARELFEEASDTLNQDFKKLCFDGPEEVLILTENTQPALLLVSTVMFRTLQSITEVPWVAMAGHSVGEYSALVASGVLEFSEALKAVRTRGQAMQEAVPAGEGGMLAVMGLTDSQVLRVCGWAESEAGLGAVDPANFNAPGQIVISGAAPALKWIQANLKPDFFLPETPRLKLIPLKVSAPFHCRLMGPAEEKMRAVLNGIHFATAEWPVVQNFTALESIDPTVLRTNLISQVTGPVRWTQCMQRLMDLKATRFVELGAGKVLGGLAKKIDSARLSTFNITSLEDLRALETSVPEAQPAN